MNPLSWNNSLLPTGGLSRWRFWSIHNRRLKGGERSMGRHYTDAVKLRRHYDGPSPWRKGYAGYVVHVHGGPGGQPLLFSSPIVSSRAGGNPISAVWKERRLDFFYKGRLARYSCDGLRDKVRALLLDLGARRDVRNRCGRLRG